MKLKLDADFFMYKYFNRQENHLGELHSQAKRGSVDAQYKLAEHYFKGEDIPQNYKKAKSWFKKSAQQGHLLAQSRLGWVIPPEIKGTSK